MGLASKSITLVLIGSGALLSCFTAGCDDSAPLPGPSAGAMGAVGPEGINAEAGTIPDTMPGGPGGNWNSSVGRVPTTSANRSYSSGPRRSSGWSIFSWGSSSSRSTSIGSSSGGSSHSSSVGHSSSSGGTSRGGFGSSGAGHSSSAS